MLRSKPYHWCCLLASVFLEVGGTLVMKLAQGWAFPHAQVLGLVVMWLAIAMSYYFLSKAVTGIPVGVTFAFWEGLGLTCITLGSVLFLNEALTLRRALGLACVLSGALLVNYGTGHGTPKPSREDAPTDNNKAETSKQRAEAPALNNGLAAGGNR
ncbi:MAG TPA: multidrug efflux SMR transporter [Desulfovibrio sp.]|uniref:DMT family transporter n=1 Tax=Desulfovibrio sp. TaxID=885 RepID=UPI002D71DEDE|nr:multidrug efflux SMR transporter [Desulfovibrio sp.]HZF62004.1 multidrug efflux SMR transporter [Desulfovibrio sp.]